MNNPPVAGPINILISLETICDNRAALDRLAELALLMQARLHGLYVEDEELLDIAEFPFTQEVRLHSAAEGGLERNLLEQQMRSVSRQAEALLAQVATQWGVEWQFQRVRGKITTELSRAAQQADIVSILAGNRSSYRGRFLSREQAEIKQLMNRPCVVLPPRITPGKEVIAVIDREQDLPHLLEPARLISQQGKRPVIIILQNAASDDLRTKVEQFFQNHPVNPQIVTLRPAPATGGLQELLTLLNRYSAHMVLIHADNPLLAEAPPETWARQLNTPVMLIR
ncbi:MAG: hypothetical protein P1U54_10165 [Immundisolibacteraceae bacterium]|nr:hypothetical protein [Immundisolibacteraceae bacterium]